VLDVTVHTAEGDPALIEKAVNRAKHHGVVTKVLKCDVKVKTHIVTSANA